MALRLIRICSVAAILEMGLMVHDPTAAAGHEALPLAHDSGPDVLSGMTDGALPPDAPVPSELAQPEASAEPAPTEVPEPEASAEPAPTEVPEAEASTEPAPTEVPEPEASAEPISSDPAPEASTEPAPTEMPQAAPSVEPTPTAEPIPDAVIEPTSDVAAPGESPEPTPNLATDALAVPQPPIGAGTTHADSAATADARPDGQPAADLQPSTSVVEVPAPATATPGDAAPSTESSAGPGTVSTLWASADAPGTAHSVSVPVLEAVEPVSAGAGVVAGIAVSNRAPAVAVAMEFGRAGSGWAGAIVFNLWLRRQMRERRMSQRQLAVLSGVNHSTISRLIHQDRQPSLDTATKLAKALRKAGGELDTADYFDRLPEETLFPARRVELALRGDELLDDEDVQRLMRSYLHARESRRGIPASVVVDGSSSTEAEAPR